jgi:hypothetical protein
VTEDEKTLFSAEDGDDDDDDDDDDDGNNDGDNDRLRDPGIPRVTLSASLKRDFGVVSLCNAAREIRKGGSRVPPRYVLDDSMEEDTIEERLEGAGEDDKVEQHDVHHGVNFEQDMKFLENRVRSKMTRPCTNRWSRKIHRSPDI